MKKSVFFSPPGHMKHGDYEDCSRALQIGNYGAENDDAGGWGHHQTE